MSESVMKIEQATELMFSAVKRITHETIDEIYPQYYPAGAVDLFKRYHSDENILSDIKNGYVFLLYVDAEPIATITINGNHILRLFVLSEYQHKGYGNALLDFAEKKIAESYTEVELDASFPAKHIYLKRGYSEKEYHKLQAENGDYLCYDVMVKNL